MAVSTGSISSPGIGSSLDVTGIVSKLMATEQQPLVDLQNKQASYNAQVSAFGSIKSALAALQDAANALATPAKFSAYKATVADGASFSAQAGSSAVAGTYDVEVQSLAVGQQSDTGTAYTSPSDVVAANAGTLTVTINGTATDIAIGANATLSNIRDAINDAGAGISASIVTGQVNGATVSKLFISASTAGTAGAYTLSNADGNLSGFLGNVTTTRAASDATVVVNGVSVTSSSNAVTNAIDGVTLNLTQATPGTTSTLTVATDGSTIQANIEKFVSAYNAAMNLMRKDTSYDASTSTASILMGDSLTRNIMSSIRSTVAQAVPGLNGSLQTLADVGISTGKDGTLTIDSNKLQEALGDPAKNVGSLFVKSANTTGIASTMSTLLDTYVAVDGMLADRTNGLQASLKTNADQQQAMQAHLDAIQQRYLSQYTALDAMIASMSTTSSYLTQQLAKL